MAKKSTKSPLQQAGAVPDVRLGIGKPTIGTLMRVTLAKLRHELRLRLAMEGIPWSVWYFLRALWENDELTQRELTARVGLRQPTTVSALQNMERLGLVTLLRDTDDRRKLRIRLTDKGKRLKQQLLPDVIALNDTVALKDFSDKEIADVQRLLLKMYQNLSDYSNYRLRKLPRRVA